jgi:hypothetical protein
MPFYASSAQNFLVIISFVHLMFYSVLKPKKLCNALLLLRSRF